MQDDAITVTRNKNERSGADIEILQSRPSAELNLIYSPLNSTLNSPSSPVREQDLAYRKHVEGPLTPPNLILPSNEKGPPASLPDNLLEAIVNLPAPITVIDGHASSDADLTAFFEETVRPFAEKATREVEQEQLQEADATKRVDVPVMDFSTPVAPWKTHLETKGSQYRETGDDLSRQVKLLNEVVRMHFKDCYWTGAKRVERELRWMPFPLEMGRITTDEAINDDSSVERHFVIVDCQDNVDSSSLIWKPEGLMVLKRLEGEEDEDELELSIFSRAKDMRSLVMKRKLQLNEDADAGDQAAGDGSGGPVDVSHTGIYKMTTY